MGWLVFVGALALLAGCNYPYPDRSAIEFRHCVYYASKGHQPVTADVIQACSAATKGGKV